jgi:hypothetical protein
MLDSTKGTTQIRLRNPAYYRKELPNSTSPSWMNVHCRKKNSCVIMAVRMENVNNDENLN